MKSSSSSRLSRSPPFSLSLNLLEPILFVNQNAERPLVLRGEFHLHVTRTVKLSTLSLSFVGLSRARKNYGKWQILDIKLGNTAELLHTANYIEKADQYRILGQRSHRRSYLDASSGRHA